MGVKVERSIDMLAVKVVRTRRNKDNLEALTAKGWIKKISTEQLKFDDTMLWEEDDLQDLVNELAKIQIRPE